MPTENLFRRIEERVDQVLGPVFRARGLKKSYASDDGLRVVYASMSVEVTIYKEWRDQQIWLTICELQDGKRKLYESLSEYEEDCGGCLDLIDVVEERAPHLLPLLQTTEYPLTEELEARLLEGMRTALERCCQDLLGGDFQLRHRLLPRMRHRRRQMMEAELSRMTEAERQEYEALLRRIEQLMHRDSNENHR